MLACLDGYMNIAMEQTEEYVNGQLKAKYGDTFIRGNNGTPLPARATTSRAHIAAPLTARAPLLSRSALHQHAKAQGGLTPRRRSAHAAERGATWSPTPTVQHARRTACHRGCAIAGSAPALHARVVAPALAAAAYTPMSLV